MIKKYHNTISLTMKPKGIIRKSVFFLSLIFTLLPNFLWADLPDESPADSDSTYTITIPKSEENILHISEGTVVYGMENISKGPSEINTDPQEKKVKLKHKEQNYLAKTEEKKPVAKKTIPKIIVKTCISKNSTDFFDISKKHFSEGTVNTNLQYKVAIIYRAFHLNSYYHGNTNSSYTYSNFLKGGMVRAFYYTRPPPFV